MYPIPSKETPQYIYLNNVVGLSHAIANGNKNKQKKTHNKLANMDIKLDKTHLPPSQRHKPTIH